MALYAMQGSITIDYAQNNAIAAHNGDIPNLYMQHRYAAATVQTPII